MSVESSLRLLSHTTLSSKILLALALVSCYVTSLAVYRLFISPLASIPGPKIAALTSLYGAYHDVYRRGRYIWVIEEMHKQYGPIVRIRPDAVHINDPGFLDQVYGIPGKRRNKSQLHCNASMVPGAFHSTSDHDLHRTRRSPLNPFFSKQSIRRVEPIVQRSLGKVLHIFAKYARSGVPLDLWAVFVAATGDIITEYSFGDCWNNLDAPDYNEPIFRTMAEGARMWHLSSYQPWIMQSFQSLPDSVVVWLFPAVKGVIAPFSILKRSIEDIKASKNAGTTTVFRGILDSRLSDDEKSPKRLLAEARVLLAAGSDTTATMLSKIIFHLLSNPQRLRKLKNELERTLPDDTLPDSLQVENLPYLNAVIQETLRLHPSGSMRQERIAPDEDLVFEAKNGRKYQLPRGTTMAMTAPLLSLDPELYPSPYEWRPERFLENPHLSTQSLTFSRGTRICLGMNLAWAEISIFLAAICRHYDIYDPNGSDSTKKQMSHSPSLELFETSRADVDIDSDNAVPFLKEGSRGVRVIVRA